MEREALTHIRPAEIEARSMELIEEELQRDHGITLPPDTAPVIKRVIHTTAEFRYAKTLYFSEGVMEQAMAAIKESTPVVTDTEMARAGINKKALASFGCELHCYMSDPEVAAEAKRRGVTRATVSMERAAKRGDGIFVVGNAPTALVSLYDLYKARKVRPALLIAAPVGFVNVMEAKELVETLPIPMIVSRGRYGGSNVAAAIVNALLLMAAAPGKNASAGPKGGETGSSDEHFPEERKK